jgi:hypothetical protein
MILTTRAERRYLCSTYFAARVVQWKTHKRYLYPVHLANDTLSIAFKNTFPAFEKMCYCSYPPHARRALIFVALFIKIVSCNNKHFFHGLPTKLLQLFYLSESLTVATSLFTHFEMDRPLRSLPWVKSKDLTSRFTQQNYVW